MNREYQTLDLPYFNAKTLSLPTHTLRQQACYLESGLNWSEELAKSAQPKKFDKDPRGKGAEGEGKLENAHIEKEDFSTISEIISICHKETASWRGVTACVPSWPQRPIQDGLS